MTKSDVVCKKCGARLSALNRGWSEIGAEQCIDLRDTSYANSDSVSSGLTWCPSMADSAPSDHLFEGHIYRAEVEAEIKRAQGQ